ELIDGHLGDVQLHRAREIEESLDYAIEAEDLARDDLHLLRDIGFALGQLHARHLDVHEDGIERILDFVGDAGGDLADGGEAVGGLELAADLAGGFGVAEAHGYGRNASWIAGGAQAFHHVHAEQNYAD